jgi:hypothetical protein
MVLPSLPVGLSYLVRRDDYQPQKLVLDPEQTPMDGGNVRTRGRPGDNVMELQQTLRWTSTEYATFDTFFRTTLSGGKSRFTMPVWLDASNAYVTKTVQLMPPFPQPRHVGRKIHAPMTLRVYGM